MRFEEQTHKLAVGDVTLVMYRLDDSGNQVVIKADTIRNLIVNKASTLMARRMAPNGDPATYNPGTYSNHIQNGFTHLALGSGVGTGTLQAPQESNVNLSTLRSEVFRKPITSWRFLTADGATSVNPTNVLELTTDVLESEAVAALTEMGLFGGDATNAANSGHLFNHKVFAVWNKPADARLKIIWKISF